LKENTQKPFGVNLSILPGLTNEHQMMELLKIVSEEKVPVVETSGRSPEPFIQKLKSEGIKLIHKVPSVRFAQKAESVGADAVTVVGFECGGRPGVGEVTSLILVPKAVESVKIPIIAGGGIADGRGFLAALALGAEGVLMGTRFVATQECPAHPRIKEAFVNAMETDTLMIYRSIKKPARVLRTEAAGKILSLEQDGAGPEELLAAMGGRMGPNAYREADVGGTIIGCGQCVGLIHEIKSVKEVIDDIIQDAQAILQRLNSKKAK
jgi:nitronate monooxygenase